MSFEMVRAKKFNCENIFLVGPKTLNIEITCIVRNVLHYYDCIAVLT